jgi:hypothetical protein
VGDIVQTSYSPPDLAMVYHDDHDGRFTPPEGFDLVGKSPLPHNVTQEKMNILPLFLCSESGWFGYCCFSVQDCLHVSYLHLCKEDTYQTDSNGDENTLLYSFLEECETHSLNRNLLVLDFRFGEMETRVRGSH